eukprot:3356102-Rhodomonas_salina.1
MMHSCKKWQYYPGTQCTRGKQLYLPAWNQCCPTCPSSNYNDFDDLRLTMSWRRGAALAEGQGVDILD